MSAVPLTGGGGDVVTGSLTHARARDAADPLRGFRERFWHPDGTIYLGGNSLGRLPLATRAVLRDVVDREWGAELVRGWGHWMSLPRQAGDELAAGAVQARPGEVIVTDSTSVNLYKLAAAALAAQPGRRVIVTAADEFPTDSYVLQGLAAAHGCHLRMVEADLDGGPDPDAVRAAVGPDTALVALSHVAYRSGALADMQAITRIAHQAGALMLWDVCHSVGVAPVPLTDADVDLAVGCTYKYLNSGPAAPAFLYVRRDLQPRLAQPIWGWFGQRDQFEMGPVYQPVDTVERFMASAPSILATYGVLEGARLVREAGIDRIRAKSMALTGYAVDLVDTWLAEFGMRLASPRDPAGRGSHITVHHPQAWRLCQALLAADVVGDYRRPDRLRLGFAPLYVRFADVHEAFDRLRDILAREAHLAYPATPAGVT